MKAWLREPVGMSRVTLLAIALTLGILGAAGVVGSQAALHHLNEERERAVRAETLTRDDVAAIAKRILRIESPSRAELLARIQAALRACMRDPSCADALRAAAGETSFGDRQTTRRAPLDLAATRRGSPAPGDGSPRRRATRRPDRRQPSPGSPSDPSAGPDPSPAPGPPAITTPPLPGAGRPMLCTPLLDVNC